MFRNPDEIAIEILDFVLPEMLERELQSVEDENLHNDLFEQYCRAIYHISKWDITALSEISRGSLDLEQGKRLIRLLELTNELKKSTKKGKGKNKDKKQ